MGIALATVYQSLQGWMFRPYSLSAAIVGPAQFAYQFDQYDDTDSRMGARAEALPSTVPFNQIWVVSGALVQIPYRSKAHMYRFTDDFNLTPYLLAGSEVVADSLSMDMLPLQPAVDVISSYGDHLQLLFNEKKYVKECSLWNGAIGLVAGATPPVVAAVIGYAADVIDDE